MGITVEQANEIMARECGIGFINYQTWYIKTLNNSVRQYEWTIEDPRCLFIVINYLLSKHHSNACSVTTLLDGFRAEFYLHNERIEAEGETPEAALIACILQIAEQLEK